MNLFGGDWNEWKLALMAPRSLSGRVVALALVLVVLVLAFRALRGEQPRRRWLLLGLRTVGILATLLLFFQPTIRLRAVSRMPNHIAVVVDASESMRLAEEGGGEHRAERAAAHLRPSRSRFRSGAPITRSSFIPSATGCSPRPGTA
jgi:hypothetical protein